MKFSKGTALRYVLAAVFTTASATALADESSEASNWSVTLGFKAWANEWQTWGGFNTARATAYTPSVTVKYKDVFVSASTMLKTNYSVQDNVLNGATTVVPRRESDFALGYYVHPQVGIMLGYKQATQEWPGFRMTWRIPSFGLSMSAPVQGTRVFMYGNAAVGRSFITVEGATGFTGGLYTTSEIGLGYSVTPSFRLIGGYKYQVIPTKFATVAANGATVMTNQLDATRGFVLGGSYTF